MSCLKKFIAFYFVLILIIFSSLGCLDFGNDKTPSHETHEITDTQGRTVTVKKQIDKIVLLESSHAQELIAVGGEDAVNKIIGWDCDFSEYAPDVYSVYLKKYPQIENIKNVGLMDTDSLNIELIVSLKPDVVIVQNWHSVYYQNKTNEMISKLEFVGIPVVFVDFYEEPVENTKKSIILIGELLGRESRAQKIVQYYNKEIETVLSRLNHQNLTKPTVYIETGYLGPSEYGQSFANSTWGYFINIAGGDNIALGVLNDSVKSLNPEFLIYKNPDIIILTGRTWKTPGSVRLGYTTSPDDTKKTVEGYINRPGWSTLSAVQNNRVYAINHGYCFSIYNYVPILTFAKWFYPEKFKDIDPDVSLKEFHDLFLPIEYEGTHIYKYSNL